MTQPYIESLDGLPDLGPLELPPLPDDFDTYPDELREYTLTIRDTQQAMLDLRADLLCVRMDFAPVVLPTVVYHLALCGWRRTAGAAPRPAHRPVESMIRSDLSYPQDARGAHVDFNFAPALRDAIAHRLALCGWRLDVTKRRLKRRELSAIAAAGVWADACVWVPIDAPDRAEDDLRPEDTADSTDRPTDVRTLAARRDGVAPQQPRQWSVKPTVNFIDEERPTE